MADDPKTPLPDVTITAKRVDPKKYRLAKEKVKLYPNGQTDKDKVDSLDKVGFGKVIGKPMQQAGQMDTYSPDQSDTIKKLLK